MTRSLRLNFNGVVEHQADARSRIGRAGDAVIVSRGRPRAIVISCPCGCGVHHPINLDARSGPAWRLYAESTAAISVYPSVWRTEGCKSHYIVWRGRIQLFGAQGDANDSPEVALTARRKAAILNAMSPKYRAFVEVAEELSEIPWDTLDALRKLEAEHLVEEGAGLMQGHFRQSRRSNVNRN